MRIKLFTAVFFPALLSTFITLAQPVTNTISVLNAVAEEATATLEAYKMKSLGDKLLSTSSGIQYVIHELGTGTKAKSGQYVLVDYYGMLMDGMRFDDSYKNGYSFGFPLGQNQVIAGFDEALTLLPAGSRFTVFIPPNLAYGENGAPPVIPANAELVFHLNFIKIESQD
ncbi:MAG: FKBP-type peptidyl-prolyl cis-trans isomerase [Saprospiraceae bacterium]|nr:FKBP-type peptidyl-prolyl cis-trans isomerase [Saprospiraceae bacterium]